MIPVYFEQKLVGEIEGEGATLQFRYAEPWVNSAESFPISARFPILIEPFDASDSTNWFANLLPEEDQLVAFARLNQAHPADLYSLLQRAGRETAGALSIGGPEAIGRYDARNAAQLENDIEQLPARPLLAGGDEVSLSLAGAQSKMVLARLNGELHLPLNGAASTHILKPANRLYASIANEALCMRLAQAIGLEVANVETGRAGRHAYILIERYDRARGEGLSIKRLHQEDAAQALGLSPLQKYEARGGATLRDLFDLIDNFSQQRVRDRLELRDRVIFNACIGNTDAHAKNFSFMISNGYRLAPAYDLLSAAPYNEITENMAMKIGGGRNFRHLSRKHWLEFAAECRLAASPLLRRVQEIVNLILTHIDACSENLAREPGVSNEEVGYMKGFIIDQANGMIAKLTA
jgi:serine/threonine-protein kinase HipA